MQTWVWFFSDRAPLRILYEVPEYQIEQFSPKLRVSIWEKTVQSDILLLQLKLGAGHTITKGANPGLNLWLNGLNHNVTKKTLFSKTNQYNLLWFYLK